MKPVNALLGMKYIPEFDLAEHAICYQAIWTSKESEGAPEVEVTVEKLNKYYQACVRDAAPTGQCKWVPVNELVRTPKPINP